MFGQWLGNLRFQDDSQLVTVRVDLEDIGSQICGSAYLFYPDQSRHGFLFPINLPKVAPHRGSVPVIYLYGHGGRMTQEERNAIESEHANLNGNRPPSQFDIEIRLQDGSLNVIWSNNFGENGNFLLEKAETNGDSTALIRSDLLDWNHFREWAVSQRPRDFIFRGQRRPLKIVSTFHRTRRKDLRRWVGEDVSALYGSVAEQLSYPLQLGNTQHNPAIWSILQHHGYPTPMIDWSISPFVAAYFAFQDADQKPGSAPRIYIFDQARWNARYGRAGLIVDEAPNQLVVIESMPAANPRHAPQRAISTVTNLADVEGFVRQREIEDHCSYLTACDLPLHLRPQIMNELELMGITYGSLFPGLDGICRDMYERRFAEPFG
jgi:hypothetical protein